MYELPSQIPGIQGTNIPFSKGPVMAYLKKVDDAINNPAAGPGDGWFKISEVGYSDRKTLDPLSYITCC